MHTPTRFLIPTITCLTALLLSGCSTTTPTATPSPTAKTSSTSTQNTTITEAPSPSSRLALTYDGGIMVLDGKTFEVLTTINKEGFLRLQPAGDNRHLVVADGSSYTMLDLGAWTQQHGDHDHHYTTTPSLTQLTFPADKTGHVISGHGKAAMFADGTGTFEIYNPSELTDPSKNTASSLKTHTISLPTAHHGFAIPLADDRYLVSVGTEESRTGAAVIDTQGNIITENNDCPGIHGEAHAANNTYTLGCQDGALIYTNDTFTKVTNPQDPYSRSGNQAGDPNSPIVLADYKTDKDATLERPEQFALINTITQERTVIPLPKGVSYTFRSLARGPESSHLLLTTDGKLRYWAEDGAELGSVDIMEPWTESTTWQDPRPAIWVDGETAYVTDPASKKLHVISLAHIQQGTAEVFASVDLPHIPNEINGIPRSADDETGSGH